MAVRVCWDDEQLRGGLASQKLQEGDPTQSQHHTCGCVCGVMRVNRANDEG